ncbi:lipid IV(A) 3-deoxy-D-manno-octulosonic acid transferase [Thiococcus pfennigii]|uniref:lipid IV(A) 3-deoxy-D-manno-octulosonic acid transferase n=1 Tax=Thiococcus pfennigii TaxID=1057 RepID=UPI001908FEBA|nr:lipid IV(A) 3-deoxy-D-manno-octulosonic acid transferase [Thiococcus pfennigii]MBK1701753.1 3-deoxy-D-manno-octulosonic acid transferase [Thiococcus pfennigii]MBK1730270.1 3-deoxy-D-manno-octulosonic acid transferase [Thiococcus pfennigii]
MERLYNLLLWLLTPAALLRLLWRSRRLPAYRQRWRERLARYDRPPPQAEVWLHAVSVGEVQAAQPLIRHLCAGDPPRRLLVTTTTPTGAERLAGLSPEPIPHLYTPFDLKPVIARFLDRVRPRLVVIMETEVWPNLLRACEARGIPVILANARLSERSARGYARLGRFAGETFARFHCIAAQAEADAARFRALGAPPDRVCVTGSVKFDLRLPASLIERAEVMRRHWGSERPVWVAASTHAGEEEQVLAAHAQVRRQWPAALLVLVPRHPERFERVAALVARRGLTLVRRSAELPCTPETAVFLGDSMGELPAFLAAADAAFIGGSLVAVGGHNPVEAAALGIPVVIGPHVFNFASITENLLAEEAAVQVADARALGRQIAIWLGDATERARIGENGQRVVASNRGATQRLIALVDERLG